MKRTTLALSCLLASFFAEAQIYQYKDAAGQTVYSDQLPTGGTAKSRTVSKDGAGNAASAPTAPGAKAAAPAKSAAEKDMEFKLRQKEQQEAAAKSEKEAAKKAARKEDCERARKGLQVLDSGQRVTTMDEKGEQVFLDDDQRAAEAERTRKFVAETCK